jgi:hypothetical protein
MCNGQDLDVSFSFTVNNRKGKALQDELARSVQTLRPTLRRCCNQVYCLLHFGDKVNRSSLVSP